MGFFKRIKSTLSPRAHRNPWHVSPSWVTSHTDDCPPEVLTTHIRMRAHFVDKDLQLSARADGTIPAAHVEALSALIAAYERRVGKDRPDIRWAVKIRDVGAAAVGGAREYPWTGKWRPGFEEAAFLDLMMSRRSVRVFTQEEISDDLIRQIVRIGMWAPTTCNTQVVRCIAVRDASIRERIAAGGMRGTMSPCIIAPIVDLRFFPAWQDGAAALEAGMAAQNILLAAHFYGLGACYVAGPSIDRICRESLQIKPHERVDGLIWVGHYEKSPMRPERRDLEEALTYA